MSVFRFSIHHFGCWLLLKYDSLLQGLLVQTFRLYLLTNSEREKKGGEER